MSRKMIAGAGVAAACLLVATANAQTYVGSFQVDDGPHWSTNPDVYSGLEAAALLFGGDPNDYRISTDPSQDPNTITDTAWYSTIGIGGGQEYPASFSQDLGGAGYGASGWASGDDISAYVDDNAIGAQYTNHVWLIPSPGSTVLLGMAGLMACRRRR